MNEPYGWREGDNWREYTRPALPPLLQTAVECFTESGYHGTSTRNLAARAGLSVPGYYHHHASKQSVLVDVMAQSMTELLARTSAAVRDAGPSPLNRLDAYVECMVLFHAHRGQLAFIAASEIRALNDDARAAHISSRDRQQAILEEIVADGITERIVSVAVPQVAILAVTTLCTGVAQWYRPNGPLTPEQLSAEYVGYARSMLGVPRIRSSVG